MVGRGLPVVQSYGGHGSRAKQCDPQIARQCCNHDGVRAVRIGLNWIVSVADFVD